MGLGICCFCAQPAAVAQAAGTFGVLGVSVFVGRTSIKGLSPSGAFLALFAVFGVAYMLAAAGYIAQGALVLQVGLFLASC
jgi:hypothetical protein